MPLLEVHVKLCEREYRKLNPKSAFCTLLLLVVGLSSRSLFKWYQVCLLKWLAYCGFASTGYLSVGVILLLNLLLLDTFYGLWICLRIPSMVEKVKQIEMALKSSSKVG